MPTRTHILLPSIGETTDDLFFRQADDALDGHYRVFGPRSFDPEVTACVLERRNGPITHYATAEEALCAAEDEAGVTLGWSQRQCPVYTAEGLALPSLLCLESTIIS